MSDQYHDPYQQPQDPYAGYDGNPGYDGAAGYDGNAGYDGHAGRDGHGQYQGGAPGHQGGTGHGGYAGYDPHAGDGTAGGGAASGGAYGYGYPQQQPHQQQHQQPQAHQQPQQAHPQQQGGAAWPTAGGQQNWAPVDDQPTQTWQAQTWDTQAWQQQLPVAEPSYGTQTSPRPPAQPSAQSPAHSPAWAGAPDPAADAAAWPPHQRSAPEAVPAAVPAVVEEPERPMTAAEKAKAEGRPQILSPGFRPALLTAVLAALVAVAAPLGQAALVVPVVLLQAVTAAGWFRLNGMWPARQGIALAFLGGLVADAGLLAVKAERAPTVLLGTLGVWLLLVVMLQLRSHASPDERLYGLTTAGGSSVLAVLAAGHLAADRDAVVVGGIAVAATVLARALPLPSMAAPVVALLAAAGAGVLGGQLTHTGGSAALLGLAAGVCALAGLRVASYDYPSRFVHMTAGVALPLALAAPAVYVVGRALF
ncbi:hypothetical protein [Streptomyces huiliensis]|uniref:hypothetical protein n=1 Tax=Streptomyces huiliensis TaxID=2876027 RepID=UPI001CBF7E81|nr:hypothetical protein [Streptomyces huiliensis]MBZ4319171.1 hypothetical protein [Streptomyces huiliensis]